MMPYVEGFENFRGRIMHSHDVKNAQEFENLRICVVGTSYSAEDIASMAWKNGCKSVVMSYRTNPLPYEWPENFTTRPLIKKVDGKTATFIDGSTEEVDCIIMCTGYTHNVPYMEDNLRLNTPSKLYMKNQYKSCIW
jgi:trimethylamine monooxygenase